MAPEGLDRETVAESIEITGYDKVLLLFADGRCCSSRTGDVKPDHRSRIALSLGPARRAARALSLCLAGQHRP